MDFGTYLEGKIRAAIDGALQDSQPILDEIAKNAGANVSVNLGSGAGSLVDILTGGVIAALFTDPALVPVVAAMKATEAASGGLGNEFGLGYFLAQIGFQLASQVTLPATYAVNRAMINSGFAVPARIDAGTAARMWATGVMQPGEAQKEMEDTGYDSNRSTQLYDSAIAYPDIGTLLELRRRQLITDVDVNTALTRHGIPVPFLDQIPTLGQVLLSPADLALALLRQNITAPQAYAYAQQLGVSNSDLDILTGNTGEPPGLETMMLMLRRGVMQEADFEKGVRYSRVRNEYIPFLQGIIHGPPSTDAAIRAAVEHYITPDQAQAIAQINGLDPQYFPFLLSSWGDPISKTEALSLWNRNLIGPDDVTRALRQSRLKDEWVQTALLLKRTLIPIRQLLAIIQHGLEPPQWGVNALMEHGYTQDDAAALVSVETSGRAAIHKELAQSMITEAYEARSIERQEALDDLELLGWTEDQAGFILDLQDAKVALAEQHKAITAVRTAFLAGRISELDVAGQLAELQVRDSQAGILLEDWKLEKSNRVLELTPTDIANAAQYGALQWEPAVAKLVALGYTENDAGILLAANKVAVPKGVILSEPAP